MLTNKFDNLHSRFMETKGNLEDLAKDTTLNPLGFIYKEKYAQLTRTLRDQASKLKSLGCDIGIITITASIYKENLLCYISIQFSGISERDALSVFKLRYPTSYDHKCKISYTGKAIITPIINNSRNTGKTNTEGNY